MKGGRSWRVAFPFSELKNKVIKNKIYLRCVERRGGIIPMRIKNQWPVEVACPVLSSCCHVLFTNPKNA